MNYILTGFAAWALCPSHIFEVANVDLLPPVFGFAACARRMKHSNAKEQVTMIKDVLNGPNKRFQTKQEWVYSTLKDAIQNCALLPGRRLALDELAEQLQVSRVPVREALLQLQADGLVDMTPHAGAVVSPISLNSIHELFMILEELEVLSGRVVAEKATLQDLQCLEGTLTGMEDAIKARDSEKWALFNTEFHRGICRLSGMPFLQRITEMTLERWDRLRRRFLTDVLHKRTVQALEEHRAIYAALKARDAVSVERLLRNHNKSALKAYLTFLSDKDKPQPSHEGDRRE